MYIKKDSGVAVVVAFILILAVLAAAVGMWALLGIPGQMHEAEAIHAAEVTNALTDYKISLDSLYNSNTSSVNVSFLMPVGGPASSGTMNLEDAGVLSLIYLKDDGGEPTVDPENSAKIQRIAVSLGTSGTSVGYEGGGIYRNDNGNAFWSAPLNISLWNDTKTGNLSVRVTASTLAGECAIGGVGSIPVNTFYTKDAITAVPEETNKTTVLMYTSQTKWDADLWYQQFYEALERFKEQYEMPKDTTIELTRGNGENLNVVMLTIESDAGKGWFTADINIPEYNVHAVESYLVVEVPKYIITASVNGEGGRISPSGQVSVREGSNQMFVMGPAEGYKVKEVTVDDESKGAVTSYTFEDVGADHKIEVEFEEATTYTVTLNTIPVNGVGGTIQADGHFEKQSIVVTEGDSLIFTVQPANEYHVHSVNITPEGGMTSSIHPPYMLTNIQSDYTVEAHFEKNAEDKFTITSRVDGGGGTINPLGQQIVNRGSSQSYTITPNSGYEIDTVTVDGAIQIISDRQRYQHTFTSVTGDHTIVAKFKERPSITIRYDSVLLGLFWWYIQVSATDVDVNEVVMDGSQVLQREGIYRWVDFTPSNTISVKVNYKKKDGTEGSTGSQSISRDHTETIYV